MLRFGLNRISVGLLFLATATLSACCPDGGTSCKLSDSSSQDALLVLGASDTVDPNASPLFPAAKSVFKKNCAQCHASFSTFTEAQWVSEGYVSIGQPNQSTVFQRIRGTASGGPENMPPGVTLSN